MPLLPRNRHRVIGLAALLLALATFLLYAQTMVQGVFDGDYGEFQYMPRILGLPHPTGYPLYLLTGWLWSWLPLGTLAQRLNLLSAFWGSVTIGLLVLAAREQRLSLVACLSGAAALAVAPFFWRYAGLAAVYTLHTALLAGGLWAWLRWVDRRELMQEATRPLYLATFVTGLSLTNHPTAAFLALAALGFVAAGVIGMRPLPPGTWLRAAAAFVLPGLLYLYVPLRLLMIGLGDSSLGQPESVMTGRIAPYLQWGLGSVPTYISGRSLLVGYGVEPGLLFSDLLPLLYSQFSRGLALTGLVGLALWLRRQPRAALPTLLLFLPSALYAISYAADFARRGEIAHLEGHILPAMVVMALWISYGIEAALLAVRRLLIRRAVLAQGVMALLVGAVLVEAVAARPMPTEADRVQSESMERYWHEVLNYPLAEGAALMGHWGDLTAFWYFQHGEGLRPDLRAIFPPTQEHVEAWIATSRRPLYLAGPLLGWGGDVATRYRFVPWGILVQMDSPTAPLALPDVTPVSARFNQQIALEGYRAEWQSPQELRLWLRSRTLAPTPRDLSISVRLHGPDGGLLKQYDGRLASLWYPDGTLAPDLPILTVAELALDAPPPVGTVARLVIYDPASGVPLLSETGSDVVELGPVQP